MPVDLVCAKLLTSGVKWCIVAASWKSKLCLVNMDFHNGHSLVVFVFNFLFCMLTLSSHDFPIDHRFFFTRLVVDDSRAYSFHQDKGLRWHFLIYSSCSGNVGNRGRHLFGNPLFANKFIVSFSNRSFLFLLKCRFSGTGECVRTTSKSGWLIACNRLSN